MMIVPVPQVRDAEQLAVASGVREYDLMLRAGQGAARIIQSFFPVRRRTVVLCGGGNNGGDALVVAASLPGEVIVYSTGELSGLRGAAGCAAKDLPPNVRVRVCSSLSENDFLPGDLIVDGLLGIGYRGQKLRENVASFIEAVNCSGCPVAALDLPSGLDADTGEVPDQAIQADLTITFGAVKNGLLQARGPELCGVLRCVDIGLAFPGSLPQAVTFEEALALLPRWKSDVHKKRRGELLVCAGSMDYSGAAALTACAALRTGAGIVRLMTVKARATLPWAVICRELPGKDGVLEPGCWNSCSDWVQASNALAAGPGWGNVSAGIFAGINAFPGPVVLDADALNLLARNPGLWTGKKEVVITPHPGEAKRLAAAFGIVSSSREELALRLAAHLNVVVLLKGKFTLVADPEGRCKVILSGSSALATAGSGDVLTGVIGALLAMGLVPFDAAVLGASLHGRAGEIAGRGCIADDLPEMLRKLLNGSVD